MSRGHDVVDAFAQTMKDKLDEYSWKPGWEKEDPGVLIDSLREEANELEYELDYNLTYEASDWSDYDRAEWRDRISKECADIANYAMMISQIAGNLMDEEEDFWGMKFQD